MARKKANGAATGTSDAPAPLSNIADISKLIKKSALEVANIEKERQLLNVDMKAVRDRLKHGGVSVPAFEYAMKVFKMEEEGRNEHIDQIRINFEALGIGGQGTLFEPTPDKQEDEPPKPQAGKKSKSKPKAKPAGPIDADSPHFKAGRAVAMAGGKEGDHEYEKGTDHAVHWEAGWKSGKAEITGQAEA